ncbi:MAG: prolyl oligopeptidase family serine peptidase [Marinilabilia sp.]
MKTKTVILLLFAMSAFISCKQGPGKPEYPETKKVDTVDEYFGTEVPDPYRWLEDDSARETEEWVRVQAEMTRNYLDQIPFRDKIKKRLTELWDYEKQSTPYRKGGYWFFSRNEGLQDQSVVYVKEGRDGEERVLLDPNTLSDDGTVALADFGISEDGKYMAYALSEGGSDWQEIYVKDVETGEKLDDHIEWVKFSNISWLGNRGFYYSRYDAPEEGGRLTGVNEYQKVYFHEIGEDQSGDELIYMDEDHAQRNFSATVDDDDKYVILSGSESTSNNSFLIKEVNQEEWMVADTTFEHETSYIGTVDGKLWVLTNFGAPRYRVMSVDPQDPEIDNWEEIIPEQSGVLEDVELSRSYALALYMVDAESKIEVFDLKGEKQQDIDLPGPGSVGSLRSIREDDEVFYSFDSYNVLPRIYRMDLQADEKEVVFESGVDFDGSDYVTKLIFAEADDGAQVPLHIVHKKGLEMDGNNPLMLYGYGGFNIVYEPGFDVRLIPWLENGGIYVNAHIRGGGEYGEDWHQAGTKMNKQRVFDDFILAAEKVIEMNYTNPDKIAIRGGSNGGLLLGAVANQRPDLFAVSLPAVGVMDMLRYHKFTIGWAWAGDYGRSDESEEMFRYLYDYSPLHNIQSGLDYPATLAFTADHDDRVVPAHTFKYIAALQEKYHGDNPVLARIETKAGHGAGKPVSKQIQEVVDMWSFTFYNMDVEPY